MPELIERWPPFYISTTTTTDHPSTDVSIRLCRTANRLIIIATRDVTVVTEKARAKHKLPRVPEDSEKDDEVVRNVPSCKVLVVLADIRLCTLVLSEHSCINT